MYSTTCNSAAPDLKHDGIQELRVVDGCHRDRSLFQTTASTMPALKNIFFSKLPIINFFVTVNTVTLCRFFDYASERPALCTPCATRKRSIFWPAIR